MRMFFQIAVMLILFLTSPFMALAGEDHCANARCAAAHRPGAVRPAVSDEVCIPLIQSDREVVVLTLTYKDGIVRRYSGIKGPTDFFCVGRHWLARPDITSADLCNEWVGNATYVGEDLIAIAHKPQWSREYTACLFGTTACVQKGFKGAKP